MRALLEDLRRLESEILAGALSEDLGETLERARIAAHTVGPSERTVLLGALAHLAATVEDALQQTGQELRTAGLRRSALSGYATLRTHQRAQHLRTRV